MICHYWYFLDCNYKYEPEVCDGCLDVSTMAFESEKFTILDTKGVDYIRDILKKKKKKTGLNPWILIVGFSGILDIG